MNIVIAATDYSALAQNAVEYAADVARINNVKLLLLNDFKLSIHTINGQIPGKEIDALIAKNAERLKTDALKLQEKFGIEVQPVATFSFVEDELKNLIGQYNADLVVMGMSPKSFDQDLIGNTTTTIIKNLSTPVLAVPLAARFAGTRKVLFACDILNGVSELLLKRVKNLALKVGAEIEVLLINQTVEDLRSVEEHHTALHHIDDRLTGIDYYYKNVRSDSIISCIEKEIEHYQADLLIMVPQKHGFWDSLVHRSKTRTMAAGLNIPLLSIPA